MNVIEVVLIIFLAVWSYLFLATLFFYANRTKILAIILMSFMDAMKEAQIRSFKAEYKEEEHEK